MTMVATKIYDGLKAHTEFLEKSDCRLIFNALNALSTQSSILILKRRGKLQ